MLDTSLRVKHSLQSHLDVFCFAAILLKTSSRAATGFALISLVVSLVVFLSVVNEFTADCFAHPQLMHDAALSSFFVKHDSHSHLDACCLAAIDLKKSSDFVGAAVAGFLVGELLLKADLPKSKPLLESVG